MSISIKYNDIIKKIKLPENFSELQNEFIKEFNEDKNKQFCFTYKEEDEEIILDKDEFIRNIDIFKKVSPPLIKVKVESNDESKISLSKLELSNINMEGPNANIIKNIENLENSIQKENPSNELNVKVNNNNHKDNNNEISKINKNSGEDSSSKKNFY